ncbi:MAG: sulfite oxidase-like oxidoreductase [Rhizobacter sp.]|nr:sulfite oxidase-like oxidoreductase [Chlorobiales bacterium]
MSLSERDSQLKGQKNSFGQEKLPAGQHVTLKFPVLTYGSTPMVDTTEWKFKLDGLVESPVEFDWQTFMAMPQTSLTADFHCVTAWSMFDKVWTGVHIRDLLSLVKIKSEAKAVMAHCYGGYTANMLLEVLNDDDVLLCHSWEGQPLTAEHGGPCRLFVPKRYAWKSAKWINRLEFIAKDRPGFWEQNGYSMTADPWKEERYW